VIVVNEDNVIPDSTKMGATLGTRGVDEVGICEVADERRNLRTHAMLLSKCFVGKALENEALKERSVEIIAFAFLDRQKIVINLGA
jgi:hypothetical protein